MIETLVKYHTDTGCKGCFLLRRDPDFRDKCDYLKTAD